MKFFVLPNRLWLAGNGRRMGHLALAALLLLPVASLGEEGWFEVRTAGSRLFDGVYYVDARIDYRLGDEYEEALQKGLILGLQVQITVNRIRRFWPDSEVASLREDFELSFEPLTERFLVRHLNSGLTTSYATLFSALNRMGRITDLPVIDAALLRKDAVYEISMRVALDRSRIPSVLRTIAFWSDDLTLESDWYRWTLNE